MPRSGSTRHPIRRAALVVTVVVLCTVALGAGVVGGQGLSRQEATTAIRVESGRAGHLVQLRGPQTVTSALIAAGMVPHDGRLLSARSHKVLDPAVHPATVTVDGRPAQDSTPVLHGGRILVTDGTDQVEPVATTVLPLQAPPLPDVLRHVYRRGRPGVAREVRGKLSGELVSRTVISDPVAPSRVEDKVVALTFDDGPTTQWTPLMLRVLASRGVEATFCEVGQMVGYHPEVSRQVLDAGHQLCNHTLNHDEHLDRASHQRVVEQIDGGSEAQTRVGLPEPEYYRPAGGAISPDVIATARALNEAVLLWKVDTEDWRANATPESVLANLKRQVEPGAIILMHDGGGKSRLVSVLTAAAVIDWLRSQGYSFVFPLID